MPVSSGHTPTPEPDTSGLSHCLSQSLSSRRAEHLQCIDFLNHSPIPQPLKDDKFGPREVVDSPWSAPLAHVVPLCSRQIQRQAGEHSLVSRMRLDCSHAIVPSPAPLYRERPAQLKVAAMLSHCVRWF